MRAPCKQRFSPRGQFDGRWAGERHFLCGFQKQKRFLGGAPGGDAVVSGAFAHFREMLAFFIAHSVGRLQK
eukprot:5612011-Alexandrium_andersonii.AAC.1